MKNAMANPSPDPNAWVDETLRSLDTEAPPLDPARARARLRDRQQAAGRTKRRRALSAAVAATVLLVIAALPSSRAAAQRLLNLLTLARVDVIENPHVELPQHVVETLVMQPQPWNEEGVSDLAEAERVAGFRLSLPTTSVLEGQPKLSVIRKATMNTSPFKVAEVKDAIDAAGIVGVAIPKEWEGTVLSADVGPVVVADYGDMTVMQSPPFRMTIPTHVPFDRFMELVFRVFGRPAGEALRLSHRFVENPAMVMHFPAATAVREVSLTSGHGVLVGNPDGEDGMCFFWSTPERIYIVEADGLSEARAVAVANSINRQAE
jgi:hypothetical protein